MIIEHLAMWVKDVELMKDFYCNYFQAAANEKYINDSKQFQSYFLSFDDIHFGKVVKTQLNNCRLVNFAKVGEQTKK